MTQKTKPGTPDRSLVEGGEDHEVRELAVATGISVDEAETLIEKHGKNRDKAVSEARAMQKAEAAQAND